MLSVAAAFAANGIDFVDEDGAWRIESRHIKQHTHKLQANLVNGNETLYLHMCTRLITSTSTY